MTMPSLTENIQRKVWAAQLKKTVATLSVGLHKIAAEVDGLENTSFGTHMYFTMADGSTRYSEMHNDSFMYPFVKDHVKKTWKVLKVACGSTFDSACPDIKIRTAKICTLENGPCNDDWRISGFVLPNGATVFMHADRDYKCGKTPYSQNSSMKTNCGSVIIDINGNKNPNKLGYDIFRYAFDTKGNLFPYGGTQFVKAMYSDGINNSEYWKKNLSRCCTKRGDGRACSWAEGWGCAGRVAEENWEINY